MTPKYEPDLETHRQSWGGRGALYCPQLSHTIARDREEAHDTKLSLFSSPNPTLLLRHNLISPWFIVSPVS